jgi:hypothetical protein
VKTFHKGKKKLLKITLDDLFKIQDAAIDVFPVIIAGDWLFKFGFSHKITFTHFKLSPIYIVQEKEGWFFMKNTMKINEHPLLCIHNYRISFTVLPVKN